MDNTYPPSMPEGRQDETMVPQQVNMSGVQPVAPIEMQSPKLPKILLTIVAVLLLGVTGVGAYYFVTNYIQKDPYDVFAASIDALAEVQSADVTLKAKVTATPLENEETDVVAESDSSSGDFDVMYPEGDFKSPSMFEQLGLDSFDAEITLHSYGSFDSEVGVKNAGEVVIDSQVFAFGLDYINLEEKSYLKVNNVSFDMGDSPMGMFSIDTMLAGVLDKWFSFDRQNALGMYGGDFLETKEEDQKKAMTEQTQILKQALMETRPFVITKIDAKSGEVAYSLTIDEEKIKTFFIKLAELDGQPPIRQEQQVKEMVDFLDSIDVKTIELAFEKKTNLPTRITFDGEMKEADDFTDAKIAMSFEVLFGSYNQVFDIQAPADSSDLEELISGTMGESQAKARDAKRLSDLKQIQTALELYYNDNSNYPAGEDLVLGGIESSCFDVSGFVPVGCSNPYMGMVPRDPDGFENFKYVYNSEGGNTYLIKAELETGTSVFGAGAIEVTPNGITQPSNNMVDTDGDSISDAYESIFGTDPKLADTDGDGHNDYTEISNGYNPNGDGKLENAKMYRDMMDSLPNAN